MEPSASEPRPLKTAGAIITLLVILLLLGLLTSRILMSHEVTFLDLTLVVVIMILAAFLFNTGRAERYEKKLEETATQLREANRALEDRMAADTEGAVRARIHADSILESLTLGIIEYQGDQTIARVNRAAEQLLGIRREVVVGKSFLPMDMRSAELSSLAAVTFLSTPNSREQQEGKNPYGARIDEIAIDYPEHRDLQVTTVLVPTPGDDPSARNFVRLIRDITREKLVDRSKSNFITVAAHQLRTPLSAIRWAFNLLMSDRANFSTDQISVLESGAKATSQVITLINDLLDVSQIEEGSTGFKFTAGDLDEAVRAAVALLGLKAQEKNIALSITLPPDTRMIMFDTKKISVVIQNLLSNAINYTPPGGKIGVTLSYDDQFATITVADTGVGIPSDELARVFTKFFRSKQALQMETSGSGLGLYIAKGIVERHGGTITLDSQEGKGTIVSFTLPLRAEDI